MLDSQVWVAAIVATVVLLVWLWKKGLIQAWVTRTTMWVLTRAWRTDRDVVEPQDPADDQSASPPPVASSAQLKAEMNQRIEAAIKSTVEAFVKGQVSEDVLRAKLYEVSHIEAAREDRTLTRDEQGKIERAIKVLRAQRRTVRVAQFGRPKRVR